MKLPHVGRDRGNGGRFLIMVMVVVVAMVMEACCELQILINGCAL
jgi:hypothetical protein